MPHLPPFLAYMSICLAAVAATATVSPAPPRDSADTERERRAAPAGVTPVEAVPADSATTATRVSQRLEIEAALAQARPPVPLLRQAPPPYIAPKAPEPSAVASKTEPSTKVETPARSNFSAKAKIEEDGYKSVRLLERGPDGKWRGRALRGQTEVAVLVDEQGNVSSQ